MSMNRDDLIEKAAGCFIHRLERRGIAATPVINDNGKCLEIEGGLIVSMENLADQLVHSPEGEWQRVMDHWLASTLEILHARSEPAPGRDALLASVRSRLLHASLAAEYAYARSFAPGLIEVLCLDRPTHVEIVSDKTLSPLDCSLDELFARGRRNTAAEPIDEILDEDGVRVVLGDSLFIASKPTDMPALLRQLDITAPHGVLVAVPSRSVLLIRPVEPDEALADLVSVAQVAFSALPEDAPGSPNGLVSANVYYWAHDVPFEPQLSDPDAVDTELAEKMDAHDLAADRMIVISPGPVFSDRFLA